MMCSLDLLGAFCRPALSTLKAAANWVREVLGFCGCSLGSDPSARHPALSNSGARISLHYCQEQLAERHSHMPLLTSRQTAPDSNGKLRADE